VSERHQFEAEIIAMTLDMLGAGALTDKNPGGLVTSGGSGSIAHAVLAYREANPSITRTNMIKPETAHPAFAKPVISSRGHEDRAGRSGDPPGRPRLGAREHRREYRRAHRSAPNYGYGTVDPITELGALALERGSDSTSTGASADSSSPSAASSATTFRRSISRCPASRPSQRTRISTATH